MNTSRRSPTPTRLEWFVSTPHGVLEYLGDGPIVRPYGVNHGRAPESGLTACGKYAVGWRIFWETPFTADRHRACSACLEAIAKAQDQGSA